jgi:hypothetical protein
VVCPADGVWSGLKSEEGDAEEIKDEWEISVDPSTGRDFSFVGLRLGIELCIDRY